MMQKFQYFVYGIQEIKVTQEAFLGLPWVWIHSLKNARSEFLNFLCDSLGCLSEVGLNPPPFTKL